jgi:hypothetical protein
MPPEFQPQNPARFAAAIQQFDVENTRDPNQEAAGHETGPRELVYARWLTDWVLRLSPDASEELRLAARCQHICRWLIPRDSFPMTRPGYLHWREELKKLHAQKSGEFLRAVGYPEETVARVQALNLKKNFPHDPESRVLEDALCLVFLERQFGALAARTAEDKTINALQKAWKKMTPLGRRFALELTYSPKEKELLDKALKS